MISEIFYPAEDLTTILVYMLRAILTRVQMVITHYAGPYSVILL